MSIKPRILFNCSTNVVGGGAKNSAWFIKNTFNNIEIDWYYAISPQVRTILNGWDIDTNSDVFLVFDVSPARDRNARKHLKSLVSIFNIDVVYTMAGPTYVEFQCLHVMGISDPYVTHADILPMIHGRTATQIMKLILSIFYKVYYAHKADHIIFQTNSSRNSFLKRYLFRKLNTHVIHNAIGDDLLNINTIRQHASDEVRIFCPAADYPHKALTSISDIAKNMRMMNSSLKFSFVLTIDESSDTWGIIKSRLTRYGLENEVVTIGSFTHSDVYNVHKHMNLVFVPSILETFSASYLEAIAMQLPIVVADRPFAREICREYAFYTNPFDSKASARLLLSVLQMNKDDIDQKLSIGNDILKYYGSQADRFGKILSLLVELHKGNINHDKR